MRPTVAQCRAARAILGWSMAELAQAASVGVMTVNRFEGGEAIRDSSIEKIASAFTSAGIAFIATGDVSRDGGEGVRFDASCPD